MARHWDIKSLENAFNWARYCEKVEAQTQEKSYREQLDGQLQSLTLLLAPVTLLDLSLTRLQHAVVYLGKILLENAALPDSLRKVVQRELENSGREEIITLSRVRESREKSGRSLYYLLGNDPSVPDTTVDQAGIVIQRLARLKKASANKERYCSFFKEFLGKLTTESVGWEVVIYMLLSDIETEDDHWQIEEVKGDTLKFVMKQAAITSSLWKVDNGLLCGVCSRDDQFYHFYQQLLIRWAESMEPVYGMTDRGDLYKWCFEGKETEEKCSYIGSDDRSVRQCLCFNCLVRHVSGLLRNGVNKKWNFENSIRELSKQSRFNIWTDVLKSAKERLR